MKFKRAMLCGSIILSVLTFIFSPCLSNADPLDVWNLRNPGNDLSRITFGNGIFVAVDSGGAILTSPDGVNWTTRLSGTTASLGALAWGNDTFVAVGNNGAILSSPDSINWTIRPSGTAVSLSGVAFGGGLFIAVGETGTILTSPDGVNWTQQTSGTTAQLRGVAFGNGIFVVLGPTMIISPNGVNWTATGFSSNRLNDITFGNDTFVAVGGWLVSASTGFFDLVVTSPDGLNWTTTRMGGGSLSSSIVFNGIAFGNGTFVAVTGNAILTSPDGADWTVRISGSSFRLKGVAFGSSSFVAVGGAVLVSPEGIDWTLGRSAPIVADLGAVTFVNNMFVAVGYGGVILTSPDGVTWTQQISGTTNRLTGTAFANGSFVVVGELGTVLTSSDGVNWTPQTSPSFYCCTDVTYGNGVFVAVGGGHVITSADGIYWDLAFITGGSAPTGGEGGVTFGDGTFVAVGGGAINTSPDGVNWTFQIDTASQVTGVAFGNGIFVTAGFKYVSPDFQGTIFTSPDGINWTSQTSASAGGLIPPILLGVDFGNNIFVVFSGLSDGTIFTSPDAVNWTAKTGKLGTTNIINSAAFGNRTFVAVGDNGTILQSDQFLFGDIAPGHWAESFITALYNSGITAGCGNGNYCPDDPVTRGQMAIFMLASMGETAADVCTGMFTDVLSYPIGLNIICRFIETFAALGITGGCGGGRFCPDAPVTRGQMAVFVEAALGNSVNACSGRFNDVPAGSPFCGFIERLANDGITGGCTASSFCPDDPVTRAQMAVFLVAAPSPLSP